MATMSDEEKEEKADWQAIIKFERKKVQVTIRREGLLPRRTEDYQKGSSHLMEGLPS